MKIIKISTLAIALAGALAFTGTASATVYTPQAGQWGGTTGMTFATPSSWANGNGNVVGAHFMRMSPNVPGPGMHMDPNGMLTGHHFATHDGDNGTTPITVLPSASITGGAMAGAGQISIDVGNYGSTGKDEFGNTISFGSTLMRIEILSIADDNFTTLDAATGGSIGGSGVTATVGSQINTASATWDGVNSNGNLFDHSYIDYVFNSATDLETVIIDTGLANVMQVFVWTEQVAAVPVPAAVWLFGTAILGLFTTSRRRGVNVATAA